MSNSGIYKITNTITNKIYIGSAIDMDKRWLKHKRYARGNYHHSLTFQRSWNLHGEESFKFEVIEYCEKDKLLEREQCWLDATKSYNSEFGYNINKIADRPSGLKRTDEARERMRRAQLGSQASDETKYKMSAARRDFDKWPCAKGSKCRCDKCKKIRTDNIARLRLLKAEKEGRIIVHRSRV